MHDLRSPYRRPAVAALLGGLCLLAGSCGYLDRSDENNGTSSTAVTDSDDSTTSGVSSTTTSAPVETTAPPAADLADTAWVVNDFDGLIDDKGRVVVPPSGPDRADRPTVARAGDGSIYYVIDGRLWRSHADQPSPEEVEIQVGDITGVAYNEDGAIVVNPHDETEEVAASPGRRRTDNSVLDPDNQAISAPNGITVRILEPDAEVDDGGYVSVFRGPARLEVERDGNVEWTVDVGGVAAPWVGLVDFDGRFVMMARFPTEPADPMMQHIVYDLNCPGESSTSGCTRSFWARWGTASLVGPDLDPENNDLNPQQVDLCPTMGAEIAPPAEMTDPETFGSDFTADDLEAFRLGTLHLSTCDPLGMGDPEQDGLLYRPGGHGIGDDPADGWMWSELAAVLRGPFATDSDGANGRTAVWAQRPDGPQAVLTDDGAGPNLRFEAGQRGPSQVALSVAADAVLLSGHTDQTSADTVTAAAQVVADNRGVELTNWLRVAGPAPDDGHLALFISEIDLLAADSSLAEVQLTGDGVVSQTYGDNKPSADETTLGFAVADLASGGEGVFAELPLADDVALALGSELVTWRDPSILSRRAAWTVNAAHFRGYEGPFNILDSVPSPSLIVAGPYPRCAGPLPTPPPPELARYRRITILPAENSIDSCLEWSAVHVFVDDDDRIAGLSLDRWEP